MPCVFLQNCVCKSIYFLRIIWYNIDMSKKKNEQKSNVPAIAQSDELRVADNTEELPAEIPAPIASANETAAADPRRVTEIPLNDADENMTGGYASVNAIRHSENKTLWIVVAVMCAMCLVVGICCSLITAVYMRRGQNPPSINPTDGSGAVAAVVAARKQCVAEVDCAGIMRGSGVVTKIEGNNIFVITNRHVIRRDNGDEDLGGAISVRFFGEDDFYPADVVGYSTLYDIAVLKIAHDPVYKIYALDSENGTAFARDAEYAEGDSVVAIGNAMSMGIASYDGIISRASELLEYDGKMMPVLRTTAAENAGMSGGALFDMSGRLIGIGSYRMSSQSGGVTHEDDVEDTGFAIPVSIVYPVYKQILRYGNGGEIDGLPSLELSRSSSSAIGQVRLSLFDFGTFSAEYNKGRLTVNTVDGNNPPKGISVGDRINKIGDASVASDICKLVGELLCYRYNGDGQSLSIGLDGKSAAVAERYRRVV